MMRISICLFILLAFAVRVYAQQDPRDPGGPDSLIVGSVQVDSGQTSCDVPVYAVTDDSVSFYNLPLRWFVPGGGVQVEEDNTYFWPLINWPDIFDSVLIEQGFIRQAGWASFDPSVILNTGGERLHIWDIHLRIDPTAPSQQVVLDTTWDDRLSSILLGLRDGMVEFQPSFQRGYITIMPGTGLDDEALPAEFHLAQNYPNPFNAQTTISYSLPQAGPVTLYIYNIIGQKVATLVAGIEQAGEHRVVWDAKGAASGVYFGKLESVDENKNVRMVLLK
jgi:hypothetical protein